MLDIAPSSKNLYFQQYFTKNPIFGMTPFQLLWRLRRKHLGTQKIYQNDRNRMYFMLDIARSSKNLYF